MSSQKEKPKGEAPLPPALDLFFNTRHSSIKHKGVIKHFSSNRKGWVDSPWLRRFDWVLDYPIGVQFTKRFHGPKSLWLSELYKFKKIPTTVFVKTDLLKKFMEEYLGKIRQPFVLYVGNADNTLAKYGIKVDELFANPNLKAFFCEGKDIDDD